MRRAHGRTATTRIALISAATAAVLGLGGLQAGSAAAEGRTPADRTAAAGAATEATAGHKALSSFTVAFPAAPYRTHNIARAVELINGAVVQPGEIWSFNQAVGERTEENGFVDGIMINDGRYVKSPGGGVSAVATTMFNAMFFAGLKPVEYGAHSFYIERYPEGREATVAWGTLDLRWQNDSGHPVTVRASSTGTSVTVTLLGTKKYDEIKATKGPRTHITPPGKLTATGPTCEAQTPLEGFDVSVDRVFLQGGHEVGRETFRTHYTPRDEVTCVPESPTATPGATAPAGSGASATPVAPGTPAAPTSPTTPATPTASGTQGAPASPAATSAAPFPNLG
ncbi:VanW family protein [Streptomyces sp. ISL-43]|uniref:VanW family protein n=1 Tax=Streptomyces sp. ISL-43 TaxID=2819183 RepID=UPI001BE587C5|nr:VanW family protein [Streptomyces sp. ISL-43]